MPCPSWRQKVEDDKEKLEQIKTHGAPERSKSIVRFSRTGYRLTPEEMARGHHQRPRGHHSGG